MRKDKNLHLVFVAIIKKKKLQSNYHERMLSFFVQTIIETKQRFLDLHIHIIHLAPNIPLSITYVLQKGVYSIHVKYVYSSVN